MTWQSFLCAIHVSGLRDLPIAYGLVMLAQGGYLLWVVRRWKRRDDGHDGRG